MSDLEHGSTVGGSPILTQRNFPNHQHGPEDMRGLGNSALYDKSDSIGLDDSNSIATSKAVHDLYREVVDLDNRFIMKDQEDKGSIHVVGGTVYIWVNGSLVQIYPSVESAWVTLTYPIIVYSSAANATNLPLNLSDWLPRGGEAVFAFRYRWGGSGTRRGSSEACLSTFPYGLTHSEMVAQYHDPGSHTYLTSGNLHKIVNSNGLVYLNKAGNASNYPLTIHLTHYKRSE